jgi:hypothetical protein
VREQYEALRREALEAAAPGPRGPGLALFLARGLPAWLATLTALPPRPAAAPGVRGPTLGPAARRELTAVLAGMVRACLPGAEGG